MTYLVFHVCIYEVCLLSSQVFCCLTSVNLALEFPYEVNHFILLKCKELVKCLSCTGCMVLDFIMKVQSYVVNKGRGVIY